MPDATSKSSDVYKIAICRVGNHPMTPFEIETGNSHPMLPAIYRPPGGGFETRSIKPIWIVGINGHIVNMAVTIQDLSPLLSAVLRHENSAAIAVNSHRPCPCRKVDPVWIAGINGQTIRSIDSHWKRNALPIFS